MNQVLRFSILILAYCFCSHHAYAGDQHSDEYENIEHLRVQIENSLKSQIKAATGNQDVEVRVSNLDSRLKLALCTQPKSIEVNENRVKSANVSARVSCRGSSPWNIYVPARIEIMQEVVTTNKDLYKGHIIRADDLELNVRDTSELAFGYAQNPEQLIGNEATRNINAGSVLNTSQVAKPIAISRGDKIILESGVKGLSVSATAIAMSDGKIGEQIQVKNTQSMRVIEAFVVAPGRAVASL